MNNVQRVQAIYRTYYNQEVSYECALEICETLGAVDGLPTWSASTKLEAQDD